MHAFVKLQLGATTQEIPLYTFFEEQNAIKAFYSKDRLLQDGKHVTEATSVPVYLASSSSSTTAGTANSLLEQERRRKRTEAAKGQKRVPFKGNSIPL